MKKTTDNKRQHQYDIVVKRDFAVMHNEVIDWQYTDGIVNFTGTPKELRKFLDELSTEKSLKIIGIYNKDETFIEAMPALDEDAMPTGQYVITDVENKCSSFYVDKKQLLSILDKDMRERFTKNRFFKTGYYVMKDKLKQLLDDIKS